MIIAVDGITLGNDCQCLPVLAKIATIGKQTMRLSVVLTGGKSGQQTRHSSPRMPFISGFDTP